MAQKESKSLEFSGIHYTISEDQTFCLNRIKTVVTRFHICQRVEGCSLAQHLCPENVIGEVTEAVHKFIMDGWTHYNGDESPPRIEEDLKYEPMDRNEKWSTSICIALPATRMVKSKTLEASTCIHEIGSRKDGQVYYHRPLIMMDLFY